MSTHPPCGKFAHTERAAEWIRNPHLENCPYCEIERLTAEVQNRDVLIQAALEAKNLIAAERDSLRGALAELRTRLHCAGRRPEECYEMSLIDAALKDKP